ncbi:Na+-transporting NADH:ubiquinone oxidoreductase, subunit NqrB [Hoeflea phototrophica DFL-43]|jgi:Na+-transporting NADH:ubiquinone oxidoreductase subunit B|uniref:Na+-transporting NADH:ubiquinone oxidoreductase, subunit NqrB n=1 Tax=Hoeflea phototrophica (strain DSM 17068 / NCIMB 14078 / DFL-43) TaxID=411684 RepID=A9D761_HOEPD|nr:RnfABCDGE type electron transport complex subunit D [Hoeflea phototrophica]EDQ33017.1 Na+-transporting NADH:ubiquinone oxidoreductase, subunit NqrB [Hoeflea phototrophica DFL-43]
MTGWLLDRRRRLQRPSWTPAGITLIQLIALVPPVAVTVLERGAGQLAVLIAALIVSLGWELAFALLRGRAPSWHGASVALIFAVMAPADAALWQVALAVSFGVVFGELVFGGRGYGFLSAAAAALGFFVFSFPGVQLSGAGQGLGLTVIPGALVLLVGGLVSWRVLLTAGLVVILPGLWDGGLSGSWQTCAGIAFGLVFLVGDPVVTASTNPGRWAYGILAGGLIVLFDTISGPGVSPTAIVFAALLASIFAPLIDYLVVEWNVRHRRVKNG